MTEHDRALYDRIGNGYGAGRSEDPRLAAAINRALGDARTVINVGAGTGSYEPADRDVTAIEPSSVMIAQRRLGSPPVVQARAEDLAIAIGGGSVETFAIPHDMQDGFLSAYWRRPEAYLDPDGLRAISVVALIPASDVEAFVAGLRADLDGGEWHRRNAEILDLTEMDLGYRLVVG